MKRIAANEGIRKEVSNKNNRAVSKDVAHKEEVHSRVSNKADQNKGRDTSSVNNNDLFKIKDHSSHAMKAAEISKGHNARLSKVDNKAVAIAPTVGHKTGRHKTVARGLMVADRRKKDKIFNKRSIFRLRFFYPNLGL